MPLQPSYRSKNRQGRGGTSSRASERSQGGAYLSSVKEILDDGASIPEKNVAAEVQAQVREVAPRPEAPLEADPSVARDLSDVELPRNKRSRIEQADRVPRPTSSSSRGGTVGWNFTHSKPGSILEDAWGMATLMRHMKRTGCSLPSVGNMTNREEYSDVAYCLGQLAGAFNKAQFGFEETLRNVPDAGELAEVTELVRTTKLELDKAKAEVERLGLKADTQQGRIETLELEVIVKGRRLGESEAARRVAEQQVRELVISSQDHQRIKEAEVKQAVRAGKREVSDAYQKVLAIVQDKFSRKKAEVSLQVDAQEIQANVDLLNDLLTNEIKSAEEEYDRLKASLPGAIAAFEKAQVSELSISKLPIPQLSGSSGTFEINMFNPSFSGEYGSNLDSVELCSAPVEVNPGGTDQVMEDASGKGTGPAIEGDEVEKDVEGNEG